MSKKGGFPQKSGGYGQQNRPQQSSYGDRGQSQKEVSDIPTVDAVDNVKRKWVGTKGTDCELIVNYFNSSLKSVPFFRYCVDIQFVNQKETDESKEKPTQFETVLNFEQKLKFLLKNVQSLACALMNLEFNNKTNLEEWLTDLKKELGPKSIAIFIPSNSNTNFYDELKFLADVKLGLHTQVIKPRTFGKIGGFTINSNLFRKLISKVGGASMKVDKSLWPEFTNKNEPTLFIGVDVTHPAPSDKTFPSICEIVGNLDIDATTYGATIRIQQSRTEEVLSIGEMFLERVKAFKESIGSYPKRVVYLRDGVGDSQFEMVIDREMKSMKRRCSKAGIPELKFTVIIVQKRHTTRLYAKDCGDANGNVPPGTVVDCYITSEDQKNFFLCAHKGLLGTSKPINYFVIHDDSDYSADSIQNSANVLCNVFSRAAGPVSLPAPVYYAHLVCFRSRSYANYLRSKNEHVDDKLPERFAAHPDLKQFMYFS